MSSIQQIPSSTNGRSQDGRARPRPQPAAAHPVERRMAMSPIDLYRVYHRFYRRGWMKAAFWLYRLHRMIYGCEIHPAAEIGPGCLVPHSVGIVIGPEARIGRDCFIGQCVTLGYRYPGPPTPEPGDGNPTLGDRVLVGAGAMLFGPITVGDGAQIGANCVVMEDVPAGYVALGNPATIRPRRR